MDVVKILDTNYDHRKWADEREAADRAAEKRAAARARAIRQARRKRLVLLQVHWACGVGTGLMATMTGACIAKGIALLAVSCALGAASFVIAGCAAYERIKV